MEDDYLNEKQKWQFKRREIKVKPKAFLRFDGGGDSINRWASINKGISKIEWDCLSRK